MESYLPIILQTATLIAVLGVAALSTKFVSRAEHQEQAKRIDTLAEIVIRLESRSNWEAVTDRQLADHEERLRQLEGRSARQNIL